MSLTALEVFNARKYGRMVEMLTYNFDLFNEKMKGAIQLTRGSTVQGDFEDETYWKNKTMVRRRNAYAVTGISTVSMEMGLFSGVKVDAGTPLVEYYPADMERILQNPEGEAAIAGELLAEQRFNDMITVALGCLIAPMAANANVYTDVGAVVQTWALLMTLKQKFGDRATEIKSWALHSKVANDLLLEALANDAGLFSYGDVNVGADPQGRPLLITDIPSLIISGSPNDYYTLGLVPGAVSVHMNDDYREVTTPILGREQICFGSQAEWSYNVKIKGHTWDKTTGGASPNNAALFTAANWDVYAASVKDLPGVLGRSL